MMSTEEVTASANEEQTVTALVFSPQQVDCGEPVASIHLPPDASPALIGELIRHVRHKDAPLELTVGTGDKSFYRWYDQKDDNRRIVVLYSPAVSYIVDFGAGLAAQQVMNITRFVDSAEHREAIKVHDWYATPLQKSRATQDMLDAASASIMKAWRERTFEQPHPYWALRLAKVDILDEKDVTNHIDVYNWHTGYIDAQIMFHLAGVGVRKAGEDRSPVPAVMTRDTYDSATCISWEDPNLPELIFDMLDRCVPPSATTGPAGYVGQNDEALKDLARRMYRGEIITSLQVPPDLLRSVFMVLMFMSHESLGAFMDRGCDTVCGDTTGSTMAVNGYPTCWSAQFLNRRDTKRMLEFYEKIKAALD